MGRWLPPAKRNSPTADASLTHVAIKARLQGHPQNTRHLGLRGQTNHVWGGRGQKYREATSHQATEQALNQLSVFCFSTGTSSQEPVPRNQCPGGSHLTGLKSRGLRARLLPEAPETGALGLPFFLGEKQAFCQPSYKTPAPSRYSNTQPVSTHALLHLLLLSPCHGPVLT